MLANLSFHKSKLKSLIKIKIFKVAFKIGVLSRYRLLEINDKLG